MVESEGVTSMAVPPKRKGGRTSRWAMKKNKSYTQKNVKESYTAKHSSDGAVPPPWTPSLEREGLSNGVTVLEGDVADAGGEAGVNMKCIGMDESGDEDILGLCQLDSINEGCGELGISDMLESCLAETCGVWDLSEERERSDVVGESTTSVNGESGEWNSCSSNSMDQQQQWDWESVIEFNNVAPPNWEHQEKLLTWLWEDDDWESDGNHLVDTDPHIQNDIAHWILS
ncbi:hypothetical protein VNO78_20690 [Psophocarpus tetragonolobus]|uniref:Uncharacterized protein n=1 Tax=Psophocarpus tetragonolobus TaxID=3891 RepID=A0AAN9XHQ4_PSOTE